MSAGRRSVSDVALGWLTVPKAGPMQVIDAAASAGFGSVSLRIANRPAEGDLGLVADAGLLRDVEAALKANGVGLQHMGGIWLDGRQALADHEPALAAGARLGATICVAIVTPGRTEAQALDDFSRLCRMADGHGLRVALEFAAYVGVKTLEQANALVERSGQANAGLLVDALHLFRSGGTVAAVAALPAGRVIAAQLCDGRKNAPDPARLQTEARGDRLDVGQGELPVRELVRVLPPSTALEIEAPCLAYRNLAARERARLAADALRGFLESN